MALDPGIISQFAARPKSVADYDDDAIKTQQLVTGIRQNNLLLQQHQQALDQATRDQSDQTTVRNALLQLGPDASDQQRVTALRNTALPTGFKQADELETSIGKRQQATAAATKDYGAADESTAKASQTRFGVMRDGMNAIYGNPNLVEPVISTIEQATGQAAPQVRQLFAQAGGDPDKIRQIASGLGQTFEQRQQQSTTLATNAATNAAHLQGVGMTQAGENSRAALARQQQLTLAGMNADGSPSGGLEAEAQMIAAGKAAPPSGLAATRPQTAMLMKRVQEINPQYDATDYGAKVKAAKDFTSGQQGNAMRSFAVAGQHLDQLGTLVDALDNGNLNIVNKVGNAYSTQTGNPAPTNFDAAKDVVSKEVVKAIVAGGGGQAERQELSNLMSQARSPAQLKGVISQYRNLMGAQHDALLQQRRAAGLSDSTLPNYTSGTTPATNAQGWALHRDANGNQAYVSPDGKQFQEVGK